MNSGKLTTAAPLAPPDWNRSLISLSRGPWLRLAVFAFILLVISQRGWDRLTHADLWGEDGTPFLSQALTLGAASLLESEAGSYFTIERLIILAGIQLPLAWLPAFVCAACYVVFAAVMSRLVRSDYEWLLPSTGIRVALAAIFPLLPGLGEMAGNTCNLNWIVFCWLAFLGLKDPRSPVSAREAIVAALIMVSIGTTILLLPLFAWRLWYAWRLGSRPLVTNAAVQIALIVVVGVLVPLLLPHDRPGASPGGSALTIARIWYDHLARLTAFTPWLGDRLTTAVSQHFAGSWYPAGKIIFAAAIIGWGWRHRHDSRAQAVLTLLLGVSAWTVLAALSRPYALSQLGTYTGSTFYGGRYSFAVSFAAIIFWVVALSLRPASPTRPGVLALFLILYVTLALHRFPVPAYGAEARWQASVSALEQSLDTGCPRRVPIRQYPDPWGFEYVSPLAVSCP